MQNKIKSSAHVTGKKNSTFIESIDARRRKIPLIAIRYGEAPKPTITLAEVLNFIDAADHRQSRIILYAMRRSPWYALNQVAIAFDGFAPLNSLNSSNSLTNLRRAAV